ncbi:hypothetical protein OKW30_008126 [Paraburkholderia sp. Clong3]|uniref:type III secretion system domain-containing protein n=1 Tax=Paraburkholderia sp. Clong3 TaxID=2991061 RepID=UPI003D23F659
MNARTELPAIDMHTPIDPWLARLYQLAWKPGEWMDAQWWSTLGLSAWQDTYAARASCRPAVDAAIVKRRGFPDAVLPASLMPSQKQLIQLEPHLLMRVTALGLSGLNCQAYLLLGEYRRVLAPVLGASACDQLMALPAPRGARPIEGIEPEHLVGRAAALGHAWLGKQLEGCPVWRALEMRLPPAAPLACDVPSDPAMSTLNRLERFL